MWRRDNFTLLLFSFYFVSLPLLCPSPSDSYQGIEHNDDRRIPLSFCPPNIQRGEKGMFQATVPSEWRMVSAFGTREQHTERGHEGPIRVLSGKSC